MTLTFYPEALPCEYIIRCSMLLLQMMMITFGHHVLLCNINSDYISGIISKENILLPVFEIEEYILCEFLTS